VKSNNVLLNPGSICCYHYDESKDSMSLDTEKKSVSGRPIEKAAYKRMNGTPKRSNARKATALPPKKPVTVKDFAAKSTANANVSTAKETITSNTLSNLDIPALSKTDEPLETPTTPRTYAKTPINQNLSFSYLIEKKDKAGIHSVTSMSPSLGNLANNKGLPPKPGAPEQNKDVERMTSQENQKAETKLDPLSPDTSNTLKKALSFGSSSREKTEQQQGIRVIAGSRDNGIRLILSSASRDSFKSSKNPASDASTASLSQTLSSSNRSASGNGSENKSFAAHTVHTEDTRKISNTGGKSMIRQSLSSSSPQIQRTAFQTIRSMSPSLTRKNKYISCIQTAKKNDKRETIASTAARDKSLPPRAHLSSMPKQRREMVTSTLGKGEDKKEADDSASSQNGAGNAEAAAQRADGISTSSRSDVKRRQQVKIGKLLRSRQDVRLKTVATDCEEKANPTTATLDLEVPNNTVEPEATEPNAAKPKKKNRKKKQVSSHAMWYFVQMKY
jgi:hypothetical protein